MAQIRDILIAGGGTAGWLTAAYLARVYGRLPGCPRITLIESPDIGTIGVGEGTFPTLRITLQTLGIDEGDFLREADATYKQGVRFVDWAENPANGRHRHYPHPFDPPWPVEGAGLTPYWLLQDKRARPPFAEAMTFQVRAADAHRAPKALSDGPNEGRVNYAYHFDASKFAGLLSRRAQGFGVRHLQGRIEGVNLNADGSIRSLVTDAHGELAADFFIDCTGFRARLIGEALGAKFRSVGDHLFTDRAVALQVPYPSPDAPLPSYTISTAHTAGWTWDIGLPERRGVGYVFSSAHATDDEAIKTLRRYIGPEAADKDPRVIGFDAGYREQMWLKNCAAIGLSGSFFEPLEATGILLIEVAIGYLVDLLPRTGGFEVPARRFNALMRARCENVLNFLKLHYVLSRRKEPFWRANAELSSAPEALRDLLDMWRTRPPSRFDLISDLDPFPLGSYQYILYGMGFDTDIEAMRPSFPATADAARIFERVRNFGAYAARDLPDHRALINAVRAQGLAATTV